MNTETLATNLRNAIASNDKYHVGLYGEEACRRLMQQQRALDALKKRQDAARGADTDGRDTEPATDETASETELQALAKERDWLYNEWLRVLDELGRDDAERILDMEDDSADPPATVVLDELWKQRVTTTALCSEVARMEPEPAKEPEPERGTCDNCGWFERCESCNSYDVGWDGECHRYPEPSSHDDDDWCGEWVER